MSIAGEVQFLPNSFYLCASCRSGNYIVQTGLDRVFLKSRDQHHTMILQDGTELNTLTGDELAKFVARMQRDGYARSEQAIQCGYYRIVNGEYKIAWTRFCEELFKAKGIVRDVYVTETDTFGGQPNYSRVNRVRFTVPSELTWRQIVMRAKAKLGWTGHKCDRVDLGNSVHLYPRGCATVIMISLDHC